MYLSARDSISTYRRQRDEFRVRARTSTSAEDRANNIAEAERYSRLIMVTRDNMNALMQQVRRMPNVARPVPAAQRADNSLIAKSTPLKLPAKLPDNIPNEFLCPITTDIMTDPVLLTDGQVYERKAIEQWLKTSNKSPMTNASIDKNVVIPCFVLRKLIQEFIAKQDASGPIEPIEAVEPVVPVQKQQPRRTREPSRYNLFVKERMQALKQEQPHQLAKELMKLIGAEWRAMQQAQA